MAAACTHSATASVVHVRVSPAARAAGDVAASRAPKKSAIATRRPTVLIALWKRDDTDAMTSGRVVVFVSDRWMCLPVEDAKKKGRKPTPTTQPRSRHARALPLFDPFPFFFFASPCALLFLCPLFYMPSQKMPAKKKEPTVVFTNKDPL